MPFRHFEEEELTSQTLPGRQPRWSGFRWPCLPVRCTQTRQTCSCCLPWRGPGSASPPPGRHIRGSQLRRGCAFIHIRLHLSEGEAAVAGSTQSPTPLQTVASSLPHCLSIYSFPLTVLINSALTFFCPHPPPGGKGERSGGILTYFFLFGKASVVGKVSEIPKSHLLFDILMSLVSLEKQWQFLMVTHFKRLPRLY